MGKWNSKPSPLWKLNTEQIEEMLERYQAGESPISAAARFGVRIGTIRHHARKAGIWHGRHAIDPVERFWSKVTKTDNCWEYTGARLPNGYGSFGLNGQSVLAHRFSYEIANGPIPFKLVLDHLRRNKVCVRPEHLEAVTSTINVKRGMDFLGRKYELK